MENENNTPLLHTKPVWKMNYMYMYKANIQITELDHTSEIIQQQDFQVYYCFLPGDTYSNIMINYSDFRQTKTEKEKN